MTIGGGANLSNDSPSEKITAFSPTFENSTKPTNILLCEFSSVVQPSLTITENTYSYGLPLEIQGGSAK